MAFVKEFKEFILRGNVVDMAVGVVVGGAFSAIVKSLVDDIIMPALGLLTGGIDFSDLKIVLSTAADGTENALAYGKFINSIITFLIIGFCLFLVVKGINKLRSLTAKKKEEAEEEPEETELDILKELLAEVKKTTGRNEGDSEGL